MTYGRLFIIRLLSILLSAVFMSACTQVKPPQNKTNNNTHPAPLSALKSSELFARQRIINGAYQAVGSSYRYGGETLTGFDCSGLMRYIHRKANISIPRTAAQQRDQSRTIPTYSRLLPGDMIFFKTGHKTDHVGVYIGQGQFIHASTSQRRVMQSRLDTPYWRRHFVKFGSYIY